MNYLSILFSKNHIEHPLSSLKYPRREVPLGYNKSSMIAQSIAAGTVSATIISYVSGTSSKSILGVITSSTIVAIGSVGYFYCLAAKYKADKLNALHIDIASKKISQIDIDPLKQISNGFGEYVVSKEGVAGNSVALSEEEYEIVYPTLLKYSPSSFDASNATTWTTRFAMRDSLILEEVKQINQNYTVTFIPRTLYELVLIEECIQEDLREQSPCGFLEPLHQQVLHYPRTQNPMTREIPAAALSWQKKMIAELQTTKKDCLHRCYFHEADTTNIEKLPEVKFVAYRLNKLVIEKLGSFLGFLNYQKILTVTEKSINFLVTHHSGEIFPTDEHRAKFLYHVRSNRNPGPTMNFHYENSEVNDLHPMGLRNESDAQILRNAIALECSDLASRNLLLYRGSSFAYDRPFCCTNVEKPFSLSFGTSLFAGAMFDSGATVFHFMRKDNADGYVIAIPFEELGDSPFFSPLTHTVPQMFGTGEVFHARSKSWAGSNEKPQGVQTSHVEGERSWAHLMSNQDRSHLIQQFQKYFKHNVIFLK